MPQAQWPAAADGRYWIDVALAGHDRRVMIDLGLVDPAHLVAFEIDPALYDSLKQSGALSPFALRWQRDASGRLSQYRTGRLTARLIDPLTRQRIGPPVSVFAARGVAGLPDRVGIVFFHHLTGCHAAWDFGLRTWTIACP